MPADVLPQLQCFRVQHGIFFIHMSKYTLYIWVNIFHLAVPPFRTVSWTLGISATRGCESLYCSALSSCGFVEVLLNNFCLKQCSQNTCKDPN